MSETRPQGLGLRPSREGSIFDFFPLSKPIGASNPPKTGSFSLGKIRHKSHKTNIKCFICAEAIYQRFKIA